MSGSDNRIRVLVVDDSAFMRKVVREILEVDNRIEVVGAARNGKDGVQLFEKFRPDVVTMDVEMPVMTGIEALREIRKIDKQAMVVMISAITGKGARATMEALEAGAFDYVTKPSGSISLDIKKVAGEIIEKVIFAHQARLRHVTTAPVPDTSARHIRMPARRTAGNKLLAIGSSTGGPRALRSVISALPGDLPVPVLIVQHMPPGFTKSLADRLNAESELTVTEAEGGETLKPGHVLVAPGNFHMTLDSSAKVLLTQDPPVNGLRPTVDHLLFSASAVFGSRLLTVILTGMGRDGSAAMAKVKQQGGRCIAESEKTALIYGMPKAVVDAGFADRIEPLDKIPQAIVDEIAAS
jgi:two-component system chemotaxis response regulator CheB